MATTQDVVSRIFLDGTHAEGKLKKLEDKVKVLRQEYKDAFDKNDFPGMEKAAKGIKRCEKEMKAFRTTSQEVNKVLENLSEAGVKDIERTIKAINQELRSGAVKRGSDDWNVLQAALKRCKEELAGIRAESAAAGEKMSLLQRGMNFLNKNWGAFTQIIGAVTGLTLTIRKADQAFAEMDQEMANVRKFTGLTEESVASLNEEFKKIDTRSSRIELNKLAEEAGKLGKDTEEEVMGFVRAADQINVALDELGDGATLTISKLTNIFGDEERMGTEKAMLSVGSVINELSQSCTASASYMAEFGKRMAGVGSQANMTIPQIMSFAAVLDSQGQAVEMSATALSQLILKLYKDSAKFAKAAQLDVKEFTDLLNKDANEAVLTLLDRLREFGNLEALAPIFQDMGMDGARASAVLASLAGNIDMVREKQKLANTAFEEGTSVTKEFEVQNNTVQAGLDKAKKRFAELAITLGEKLHPIVKHCINATSLLMKVMDATIGFVQKNRKEVRTATIILAAYTVGVNANAIAMKASSAITAAWNTIMGIATGITKGYTTAMVLSRDAVAGCSLAQQRLYTHMQSQNVITKLLSASTLLLKAAYYACTLQISSLSATLKSLYKVMAANPYGIVLTALAAIGTAIYSNIQKRREEHEQMLEEMRLHREMMKEYDDENAKIKMLTATINDNTRNLEERKSALDTLRQIVPAYHADLTAEGVLINNNTAALDEYLKKLKESILLKAKKDQLAELYKKQAELEAREEDESKDYWDTRQGNTLQGYDRNSLPSKILRGLGMEDESNKLKKLEATREELADVNREIKSLEEQIGPGPVEPREITSTGSTHSHVVATPTSTSSTTPPTTPQKTPDKFEEEDNWKKEELARNRIAYAIGEKNHEEYNKRLLDIEIEYNKKKLEHTDLTELERLQIEADYAEAMKALSENASKMRIEDEKAAYDEEILNLKQSYAEGLIDKEAYDFGMEQAELNHAARMIFLYEEGSKERLQAEAKYAELQIADQEKRRKETEEKEKKHQEELAKIKEKAFGNNPEENKAAYESELALLQEVFNLELAAAGDNAEEKLRIEEAFQKAKIALMLKYNQEGEELNQDFLHGIHSEVMKFLDSELGQAVKGGLETFSSSMSAIFSQVSSMVQSELQIQEAAINRRYDEEISRAEGNKQKQVALEKQREKELARIKNEANKKLFAMQVVQAVASTALSAINAYSSAAQVPLIGYILAPIAAAAALAAGGLQIAAIKKQQKAAESKGYYSGGFTGGSRYRREAGVVHEGEFVANHQAVNNPNILPILEFIDKAQKNNTVSTLTMDDVRQGMGGGNATMVAPIVNVTIDNEALNNAITGMNEAVARLQEQLAAGLQAFVDVEDVDRGLKRRNKLINNAHA